MPKNNPTKMGSEKMEDWKARAKALFFIDKLNIVQIAEIIEVSRKTVAKYLSSLEEFNDEKEARKLLNKDKRKDYKREWDRKHRRNTISGNITGDILRREHELAVIELSREKYH